jgi:hypothetical protein
MRGSRTIRSFNRNFEVIHRRRKFMVKLLRPPSFPFDDNAELIWLHITIRSNCKRVPLKLGNARHVYKQHACWIISQSWETKLHVKFGKSCIYILSESPLFK